MSKIITAEDVVNSIKERFQKSVKPIWKEWDKDVIHFVSLPSKEKETPK